MGVTDPKHKYSVTEMARGNVMFAATGVTSGALLKGVRRFGHGAFTHSMVMRSKSGTVRYIEAHHNFDDQDLAARIELTRLGGRPVSFAGSERLNVEL